MAWYRFQAFVVVLLVLGVIPDKTNGLKCYTCENCDKPGDSDAKDCDGSCISFGTKRDCYPKDKVDCFKAAAGGDCYKPEADADKAIAGKIKECVGEEPIGPSCVCSADLCNVDSWHGVSNSTAGRSESKGVKCYKCTGLKDSDCAKAIKEENGKVNLPSEDCGSREYCSKTKFENGAIERDCANSDLGACWQKIFGNGCATEADQGKGSKLLECVVTSNHNRKRDNSGVEQGRVRAEETCICKGDLCNQAVGIKTSLLITIVSALAASLLAYLYFEM